MLSLAKNKPPTSTSSFLSSLPSTTSGYHVYQIFLALKSHFRNEGYDYIRYNGKVTASFESYMKRKDRFFFEKVAKQNNKSDFEELIIANFVYADTGLEINPETVWIGTLASSEGKERLTLYRARMESLEYNFKKDLTTLTRHAKIKDDMSSSSEQFPAMLSMFFDGRISPETVVIMDSVLNIFAEWDKLLKGDPLWTKTAKFLRKYKSLIMPSIHDTNKFRKLMIQHAKSETI
jgi:hypothetical protein